MAMLDRQQIPEKLLQRKNKRNASFVTAIGSLGGLSLITKEVENTWTIHRLVQLSIHVWLKQNHKKEEYEEEALLLIASIFLHEDHENKRACDEKVEEFKMFTIMEQTNEAENVA